MTLSTINTRTVQLPQQDRLLEAYLAEPSGDGSYAAVVVLQEIFGVNAHIRDVTERLAREGYVAIAPALYQRLAPGFETGYTADDIKIGRQYKEQTQADELLCDIQTCIEYLNALPQVKTGAIGCIGFCFGGHVAYLAATLPGIRSTASFYGAGLTTWCPGGGEPTVNRTSAIQGTIHTFFGMKDVSIPAEQVDQIASALQHYGIDHQVWRYAEADHGFFCDQRASYNAAAAIDAWEKVKTLFQEQLG